MQLLSAWSSVHNSYLIAIGVHEMHGQMHPNYCKITILLVVRLCSSLAYFMMTQPLPIASKLPIKTLVARQLPTNNYVGKSIKIYIRNVGKMQSRTGWKDILIVLRTRLLQKGKTGIILE